MLANDAETLGLQSSKTKKDADTSMWKPINNPHDITMWTLRVGNTADDIKSCITAYTKSRRVMVV